MSCKLVWYKTPDEEIPFPIGVVVVTDDEDPENE